MIKQCKCSGDGRRAKPPGVFVRQSGCLAPGAFSCVFAEEDTDNATTKPKKMNLCDHLHLNRAWIFFNGPYSEDP